MIEADFTLPLPIPSKKRKLTQIFIFTLLCGASNCFMKAFKAFIKPFEAPQRGLKIKIYANFYFNTTSWNAQGGKGQCTDFGNKIAYKYKSRSQ